MLYVIEILMDLMDFIFFSSIKFLPHGQKEDPLAVESGP
jgi:hypothetical protein